MAYQHLEDGRVVLDREAAEELAKLCQEARQAIYASSIATGHWSAWRLMETRLELAAGALMPFPEEES